MGYETNLTLVIALTCVFGYLIYAALSFHAGIRIAAATELKIPRNSIELNFVKVGVYNTVSNCCFIGYLDSSKSLLLDLAGIITKSTVTIDVRKLRDQYFNTFLSECFSKPLRFLETRVYQSPAVFGVGVQI